MALYYYFGSVLGGDGVPPEKLLDPNIAIPGDTVVSFLIENYRGLDFLGALDLVSMGYDAGGGLKAEIYMVSPRSADLFDANTIIDDALRSLAYYLG